MNSFNNYSMKFDALVHDRLQTKLKPYGIFLRKSFYKNQMKNTFKRKNVDRDDMSNVTSLGMQIITLLGTQKKIKEAIINLLEENHTSNEESLTDKSIIEILNYSGNKDKKQSIADLIMHRFFQIIRKKQLVQKLDSIFPEWKKGMKIDSRQRYREEWFKMVYLSAHVGLEILQQLSLDYKFEHVSYSFRNNRLSRRIISRRSEKPNLKKVKEYFVNKLSEGSVLLSTELINDHFVYLLQTLNEGIIINDPLGIKLFKFGYNTKKSYLINGMVINMNIQRNIEVNIKKLEHRLKYNPCLLKHLKKYANFENTDQLPRNLPEYMGERNFFNWEEIYQFQIGKLANIFY